ncbi:MAG TPA: DUF1365 domain-containing protein [Casimicrobiaceae bacterium]|jgi:hypothetical protein|nr:DUF1365 domain-containing protein [Casimicrobiaceae bacterium]
MRNASPSLIHGEVMHRRRRPVGNAFTYRSVCLALPLAQIGALPRLGMALNRRALVSFFDCDHGARDGTALEPWLRRLLAAENVVADGEIVLYAFPRMLGYVFNPVSFWVCHDREGSVRAVLCEVCNTFGECHNYLLAHPDNRPLVSGETVACRKVFHVSPFCEIKGGYRFRFHFASDRWLARIDYNDAADGSDDADAEPLLETAVSGIAEPLSPTAVRGLLWRYRWFTLGVILRIHWQAWKLWMRRVPYVAKPAPPLQRTTR